MKDAKLIGGMALTSLHSEGWMKVRREMGRVDWDDPSINKVEAQQLAL